MSYVIYTTDTMENERVELLLQKMKVYEDRLKLYEDRLESYEKKKKTRRINIVVNNNVTEFLKYCKELNDSEITQEITARELHDEYIKWTTEKKIVPVTPRKFYLDIQGKIQQRRTNKARFYDISTVNI